MKIRKLHLKNIGVFDDEEINFQECPAKDKAEIHILTGENGTGKTTILQGITALFGGNLWIDGKDSSFTKRLHLIPLTLQTVNDKDPSKLIVPYYEKEFYNLVSGLFKDKTKSTFATRVTEYKQVSKAFGLSLDYPDLIKQNNSPMKFCVFAFSGYRQIEHESIQANYLPKNFNPLSQSLEFVKDYRKEGEITINQLITNYLNDLASATFDGSTKEAKKYQAVINAIEHFIQDVVGFEIKFVYTRQPRELKLRMHGEELDFDVLPDGLRSLISWIADLLGRVDLLKWQDDLPITEKNLILLLDEIEVHLHPAWQRKVLPVVQKLFKNAQIFVSTHSPFVVNSVDDAWVYELEVKDGKAKVREVTQSNTAFSIQTVLREVFGIDEKFGEGTQEKLVDFLDKSRHIQQHNGNSEISKDDFLNLAVDLAEKSAEFQSIVFVELAKITQKTGEPYEI